jgi:hypothetical protein
LLTARQVVVAGLVALASTVALAPTALPATIWTSWVAPWAISSPHPTTIRAVSCSTSSDCVAVGDDSGPFADVESSGNWVQTRLSTAATNQLDDQLVAISCSSASSCVAVGSTANLTTAPTRRAPLVEVLSDGAWSRVVIGEPGGATSAEFSSVACPAPGTCVAVGDATTASRQAPIIATLNDGAGVAAAVAFSVHLSSGALKSVECQSPTQCVAFGQGSYLSAGTGSLNQSLLVDRLSGTTWTTSTSPLPAASSLDAGSPISASCVSSTQCWVQFHASTPGGATDQLLGTLDGSTWTTVSEGSTVTAPAPDGVQANALACVFGMSFCAAVGGPATVSDARGLEDVATFNGASWSAGSIPAAPGGLLVDLSAISCPAAGSCTALGEAVPAGAIGTSSDLIIESLDPSGWTEHLQSVLPGRPAARLRAISCTNETSCVAVGSYLNSTAVTSPMSIAIGPSGAANTSLPGIEGSTDSEFAGVACAGSGCAVVGTYKVPGSASLTRPLAGWLAGGHWTLEPVKRPTGATGGALNSVQCFAGGACVAAGAVQVGSVAHPAIGLRAGAVWTLFALPAIAGTVPGQLASLSCVSAASCVAVGSAGAAPIAARLAGGRWTIARLPSVVGLTATVGASVSCVTPARCVAVVAFRSTYTANLSSAPMYFDGASWRVGPRLSDRGAAIDLTSIDCESSTTCVTVGNEGARADTIVTARLVAPAWTVARIAPPAGTGQLGLSFVTCPRGHACTAVGQASLNQWGTSPLLAIESQ